MNKIQKQILKNQRTIMSFLHFGFREQQIDTILGDALSKRVKESDELLKPIKQSIQEKTEDALSEEVRSKFGTRKE